MTKDCVAVCARSVPCLWLGPLSHSDPLLPSSTTPLSILPGCGALRVNVPQRFFSMHGAATQAQQGWIGGPKQYSSSSSEQLPEAPSQGVCRLCLEEECVSGLVSCCGCIGTIQYIHAG